VNPILAVLVLSVTVIAAMAFGIVLGYGLFTGILHLLGRQHAAATPAPPLAHQAGTSGS
jgi:hypothetical protein